MHYTCCGGGSAETAIYLFELYPDSIDIATDDGSYPLHLAASNHDINENEGLRLISFLLKHDKGAASTPESDGYLPLHFACWWKGHYACQNRREFLSFVKLLFNAQADGIFIRNNSGDDPIDIVRSHNHTDIVHFFQIQLGFHLQAQENQEPDSNGQLPIHQVLKILKTKDYGVSVEKKWKKVAYPSISIGCCLL